MEEIVTNGQLIILTIGTAIVFLIKSSTELLAKWLEKELVFKQSIRHERLKIKHDIDIKLRKVELENSIALANNELKTNLKDTTLNDVMVVHHLLKIIREHANARIVSIAIYHNGTAKGFRNFSIRYEECRTTQDSMIDSFQSKPLSNYYQAIKSFETFNYLYYSVDDELTEENKTIISNLKGLGDTGSLVVPLLVSEEQIVVGSHKLMSIEKDDGIYYVLGVVSLTLDSNSKELDNSSINYVVNRVDDIINIYNKNHKILG